MPDYKRIDSKTVDITVDGRESLKQSIRFFRTVDGVRAQEDISDRPLRLEIDGIEIPISTMLEPHPDDPLAQVLHLTRTQVATLKRGGTRYRVVDESNKDSDDYDVILKGKISLTGFIGAPDQVEDQS